MGNRKQGGRETNRKIRGVGLGAVRRAEKKED